MKCLFHKKKHSKQRNKTILSFVEMFKFSKITLIYMLSTVFLLSIAYFVGIKYTRELFIKLQNTKNISIYTFFENIYLTLILVVLYKFIISFKKIFFDRYYIQYVAIPNFEKFLKTKIQKKSSNIDLIDYYSSNFSKRVYEATVSSTNIFRLVEIFILKIGVILNSIIIFTYLTYIDIIYVIIIIISIFPKLIEGLMISKIIEKNQKILNGYEVKENEILDSILDYETFGELKIYNTFDFVSNKFKKVSNSYISEFSRISKKIFFIEIALKLIYILCTATTYIFIIYKFNNDKNIGNLVTVLLSIKIFLDFSKEIINLQNYSQMFSKMTEPYFDFMDITNKFNNKSISKNGKIKLNNISFKYPNTDKYSLKNINLEINKGEIVAIVGENGSGKSTLAKIILDLYLSDSGEFEDFLKIEEKSALFQNFCKYPISIEKNITFDNTSKKDYIKLLTNLKMDSKFDNNLENDLYYTFLSGGEWQKIAIARTWYKDAELIVLDEPTSSIDPIFEKEIYKLFQKILYKKTGVIITHKLGCIKFVDKIIVMDKGKIESIGTHSELLKKSTIYRKLWDIQINQIR